MQRDKKHIRFNTDYDEPSHIYTSNIANYTKFQKKNSSKRKDTFEIEFGEEKFKQPGAHSTKYNPNKNL